MSINDFNISNFERALSRLPSVRIVWHAFRCRVNWHEDQLYCVGRIDQTRLIHKECHWCGRPRIPTVKDIEEFNDHSPPVH